jgi:hypothetical protein
MSEVVRRERLLVFLGVVHVALFVVCLLMAAVDARTITGINAWFKPAKFMVSVGIYLLTMACLLAPLDRALRGVTAVRWMVAVAMSAEIVIIAGQAARGTTSHYNSSTQLDETLFRLMGFFILINTAAAAWALWMYLREAPALSAPLLLAVRLGLGIFIAASLQGFTMIANNAHTVGAADGARGIFFLNWSLTHGDLRIAHFVGMHALQGLPLVAWLSGSRNAVLLVAAGWAAVFVLAFGMALAGRPLLTFPAG